MSDNNECYWKVVKIINQADRISKSTKRTKG